MLPIKFLAVFAFLAVAACYPMSCPTAQHLEPCKCKRFAFGLHISCENINKSDDLIRSFKVLKHFKIHNVVLHGLNITEVLPSDIFDGLEINRLRVEKSELQFSQPAFKGLDQSLNILNVAQQSTIKSTEDFSIARLTKLTELSIQANPVGIVRDQWLNGKIPNVHTVILEKDEITKLESNAFAKLPMLKKISLANNGIVNVERSMFPRPATDLETIDLSWNAIASLPYDFFFDMPALTEVVLPGNDLQTLERRVWIDVWENLDTVLLASNNIVCDQQLDWLKDITWPTTMEAFCMYPPNLMHKSIRQVYTT